MGKRGRPRKRGPREPNGRIQRKRKERIPRGESVRSAVLDEAWLRRGASRGPEGEIVGVDAARRPEAGYVIGRLMLRGIITQRQHNAAMRFSTVWHRWASMAGVPPHVLTQREAKSREDVSPQKWKKAKKTYLASVVAVRKCRWSDSVFRFVELLVMDDALPLGWTEDQIWPAPIVAHLRAALNRLAEFYGLAAERSR